MDIYKNLCTNTRKEYIKRKPINNLWQNLRLAYVIKIGCKSKEKSGEWFVDANYYMLPNYNSFVLKDAVRKETQKIYT